MEHAACRRREQEKCRQVMHPPRRMKASVSQPGDGCIGRRLPRLRLIVAACLALAAPSARAQMNPSPEAPKEPEKEPEKEPANEAVRAKEGAETKLPSVAGRPVRRYAQRGVLELGGALSFTKANAFTQIGGSPTFGWFFIDYVELSLLPSFEYVKTFTTGGKTRTSMVLEPSFHISVSGPVFWFFGAGIGGAYEKASGFGLAIAPRSGLNVLIGGSGILNVALAYVFTATKRTAIEDGSDEPHTSTFNGQIGYSVAW
jgi:hypothetical protein